MTLGEKLYYFRKRAHLSQDNVAKYLLISRQAVSKWETDQSRPDTDNLIKLSKLYNITLDELVSEKIPVLNEQRCVYCHQPAVFYYEQQPYCSSQCQDKYELEMKSIKKNLKWFYLGIVIGVLISLVSAFNSHPGIQSKGVGVGMMILGGTILLYPYCTPETYDLFGFKKTQLMGRVVGAITELIGLFFLI